jgi:hypothetical protein
MKVQKTKEVFRTATRINKSEEGQPKNETTENFCIKPTYLSTLSKIQP